MPTDPPTEIGPPTELGRSRLRVLLVIGLLVIGLLVIGPGRIGLCRRPVLREVAHGRTGRPQLRVLLVIGLRVTGPGRIGLCRRPVLREVVLGKIGQHRLLRVRLLVAPGRIGPRQVDLLGIGPGTELLGVFHPPTIAQHGPTPSRNPRSQAQNPGTLAERSCAHYSASNPPRPPLEFCDRVNT